MLPVSFTGFFHRGLGTNLILQKKVDWRRQCCEFKGLGKT